MGGVETELLKATAPLKGPMQWHTWFMVLKQNAKMLGAWEEIDPDEQLDEKDAVSAAPTLESLLVANEAANKERHEIKKTVWKHLTEGEQQARIKAWEAASPGTRGAHPVPDDKPVEVKLEDLENQLKEARDAWKAKKEALKPSKEVTGISKWLQTAVNTDLLAVVQKYQTVLREAHSTTNVDIWFPKYRQALSEAEAIQIPQIQGQSGAREFLTAAGKFNTPWAERQRQDLAAEVSNYSLRQLVRMFENILLQGVIDRGNNHPTFATLGGNSKPPPTGQQPGSSGSNQRRGGKQYNCPACSKAHAWQPSECRRLTFALTGLNKNALREPPTEKECAEIKKEVQSKRWFGVRKALLSMDRFRDSAWGKGAESSSPSTISAAIFLTPTPKNAVFSAFNNAKHQYFDSTLLDNCGATHLVNSLDKLDQGTFVPSTSIETVECGTQVLPVLGRGKRTFRGVLSNGADLELLEVAVVENFHVNIISEARLGTAKVWFCGLDCTLRIDGLKNSRVIKKLERRDNVVFFEYKPLSSYPLDASEAPTHSLGI
ncbi:hypothetical protein RB600_001584 [Gaeumannomyces tritici]